MISTFDSAFYSALSTFYSAPRIQHSALSTPHFLFVQPHNSPVGIGAVEIFDRAPADQSFGIADSQDFERTGISPFHGINNIERRVETLAKIISPHEYDNPRIGEKEANPLIRIEHHFIDL